MKANLIANMLLGISAASILIAIALFGLSFGYSLKPTAELLPWQHPLFSVALSCLTAGLLALFLAKPKPLVIKP